MWKKLDNQVEIGEYIYNLTQDRPMIRISRLPNTIFRVSFHETYFYFMRFQFFFLMLCFVVFLFSFSFYDIGRPENYHLPVSPFQHLSSPTGVISTRKMPGAALDAKQSTRDSLHSISFLFPSLTLLAGFKPMSFQPSLVEKISLL